MDSRTLTKLSRLLVKFPETWTHVEDTETVDGVTKIFHHVFYRSSAEGRPRVRLAAYVSADMAEMLVTLKNIAPNLISAVAIPKNRPPPKKSPKVLLKDS